MNWPALTRFDMRRNGLMFAWKLHQNVDYTRFVSCTIPLTRFDMHRNGLNDVCIKTASKLSIIRGLLAVRYFTNAGGLRRRRLMLWRHDWHVTQRSLGNVQNDCLHRLPVKNAYALTMRCWFSMDCDHILNNL